MISQYKISRKTHRTVRVYRIREGDQRDLGDILDGSVAAVGNKTKYKVGSDTIERQKYMVAAANDGNGAFVPNLVKMQIIRMS